MRATGTVPPDAGPGMVVYRPYSPQNAGVITHNLGVTNHIGRVRIRWLDGSVTDELSVSVRSLNALIEDHASKLRYHRHICKRAMSLPLS